MTREEYFKLAKLMTKAINTGAWDKMSKSITYSDALDRHISAPRMAACLLGWICFDCKEEYEKWLQHNDCDPDKRNKEAGV